MQLAEKVALHLQQLAHAPAAHAYMQTRATAMAPASQHEAAAVTQPVCLHSCCVPAWPHRYLRHFRGILSSRTLQGLLPAVAFFTGMAALAGEGVSVAADAAAR